MGKYLDMARQLKAEAPKHTDWLTAWRELAQLTYDITAEDARFQPVLRALDACDVAFCLGSWVKFQDAVQVVRAIVKGQS
jgi:hypothetical protein